MTMTSAPVTAHAQNGAVPEDDPAARPKRRQFSADYKLAILEEYERITEDGGKGAFLRREGLYSSHIVEWQRARDVGALSGLVQAPQEALGGRARAAICCAGATPSSRTGCRHRVGIEAQGKGTDLLRNCCAEHSDGPAAKRGRRGDRGVLRCCPAASSAPRPPGPESWPARQPLLPGRAVLHDGAKAPAGTAEQAERRRGRRRARGAAPQRFADASPDQLISPPR